MFDWELVGVMTNRVCLLVKRRKNRRMGRGSAMRVYECVGEADAACRQVVEEWRTFVGGTRNSSDDPPGGCQLKSKEC